MGRGAQALTRGSNAFETLIDAQFFESWNAGRPTHPHS